MLGGREQAHTQLGPLCFLPGWRKIHPAWQGSQEKGLIIFYSFLEHCLHSKKEKIYNISAETKNIGLLIELQTIYFYTDSANINGEVFNGPAL